MTYSWHKSEESQTNSFSMKPEKRDRKNASHFGKIDPNSKHTH